MKSFIYPEMMVHIPLCTHKEPKNVLIISDSAAQLQEEIARHEGVASSVCEAGSAVTGLRAAADQSADVILLEESTDAAVLAHCNRVLNEEGLLVMQHPSLDDTTANSALMEVLGNYFKIIMPYTVGNGETLLLASKAYHPTADIILQRTDLLEGQKYYNCDIHPAAFAMPNYIRKAYLGIIRN